MVDDVSKRQAELITKVIAMGQGSFYESNPAEIIIPEPIVETKSRKFRWSSCFSFITKFKKNKTQKIRISQSYEEYVFNNNEDYTTADKEQLKSTSSQGNFCLFIFKLFFILI